MTRNLHSLLLRFLTEPPPQREPFRTAELSRCTLAGSPHSLCIMMANYSHPFAAQRFPQPQRPQRSEPPQPKRRCWCLRLSSERGERLCGTLSFLPANSSLQMLDGALAPSPFFLAADQRPLQPLGLLPGAVAPGRVRGTPCTWSLYILLTSASLTGWRKGAHMWLQVSHLSYGLKNSLCHTRDVRQP